MKDVRRAGAYGRQNEKKALPQKCLFFMCLGAPGAIRTPDPLVRSQVLYPTELRARCQKNKNQPVGRLSILNWRARDDSNVRPLPSEGSTLSN